jgi:hypothetical protein
MKFKFHPEALAEDEHAARYYGECQRELTIFEPRMTRIYTDGVLRAVPPLIRVHPCHPWFPVQEKHGGCSGSQRLIPPSGGPPSGLALRASLSPLGSAVKFPPQPDNLQATPRCKNPPCVQGPPAFFLYFPSRARHPPGRMSSLPTADLLALDVPGLKSRLSKLRRYL